MTLRPMLRGAWVAGALVMLGLPAAAAPQLAGRWEIQSLGADRQVTIAQRGRQFRAYRLLQPELDGKRIRLEHVYQGRIRGGKVIEGELLVRQQGSARFAPLRAFRGTIASARSIVLDQMPLRRVPDEQEHAAGSARSGGRVRILIDGVELQSAELPELEKAIHALIVRGDRDAARGRYRAALARYLRAAKVAGSMSAPLFHRVGRCYLRLARREQALRHLRRARMLDPNGRAVAKDLRAAEKLRR